MPVLHLCTHTKSFNDIGVGCDKGDFLYTFSYMDPVGSVYVRFDVRLSRNLKIFTV